jgi:hypothetical protein
MLYPPTLLHSSRIFYLKKQFSAETMLFFPENFFFSQKIHYYHGNLKYLNNFHTSLGLQNENFDLLSHFLKYTVCDKVASKSLLRSSMFIYPHPFH